MKEKTKKGQRKKARAFGESCLIRVWARALSQIMPREGQTYMCNAAAAQLGMQPLIN